MVLIEPGTFDTEIFGTNRRVGKNAFGTASAYAGVIRPVERKLNDWVEKLKADPRPVAGIIRKAATAKKPKLRCVVGTDAKMMTFLRFCLPDSWASPIIRRTLGL